ncbi:MAG: hypothetical protein Q8L48_10885 [Archangium sp.]|nr:hypothetical protein [Archangium sp.]
MRSLGALLALWAGVAGAYPWMVKHGYGSCAACHVDPSGAGQLTNFGRSEAERVVRWTPSAPVPGPNPNSRFLWFLELPESVNLSGNLRYGALIQPGAARVAVPLEMATDLSATFSFQNQLFLHATAGFGRRDVVAPAIVAPACDPAKDGECGPSLLARTFWAGFKVEDGSLMLRGGRLVLPFGLRNNEHSTWVRTLTRTDSNVQQKLGVAVSFLSGAWRGEVMALAGAFLPADQEAGYSGALAYGLNPTTELGLSSLVATGVSGQALTRQAHGLYFRWAPVTPLVVLAEADLLAWTGSATATVGYAALAQADWELTQGLHVMVTAESAHRGVTQHGPSLGAWVSVAWYFFSHFELRLDNVVRRLDALSPVSYALVAQLHLFL